MATLQTRNDVLGAMPGSAPSRVPSELQGAAWKWVMFALMCFVIYGMFFIAKGAVNFVGTGDVSRIVFFHVPVAVLTSVWYFVGAIYAASYLWRRRNPRTDTSSATSMELGFLASILATITGSIFAGAQWGSYWNWDPREISIVGLLLIYASYLVLRGAIADQPEKRAAISAVYAMITLVPANFLIWVVPRLKDLGSLHPTTVLTDPASTSATYKLVLIAAFVAFTMLFVWMFQLRCHFLALAVRHQRRMA